MNAVSRILCCLVAGSFLAVPLLASAKQITAGKPKHQGSVSLKVDLSIGGPDADEPAQFYEKLGSSIVSADANGNVYVLDAGNNRVQVIRTP